MLQESLSQWSCAHQRCTSAVPWNRPNESPERKQGPFLIQRSQPPCLLQQKSLWKIWSAEFLSNNQDPSKTFRRSQRPRSKVRYLGKLHNRCSSENTRPGKASQGPQCLFHNAGHGITHAVASLTQRTPKGKATLYTCTALSHSQSDGRHIN